MRALGAAPPTVGTVVVVLEAVGPVVLEGPDPDDWEPVGWEPVDWEPVDWEPVVGEVTAPPPVEDVDGVVGAAAGGITLSVVPTSTRTWPAGT